MVLPFWPSGSLSVVFFPLLWLLSPAASSVFPAVSFLFLGTYNLLLLTRLVLQATLGLEMTQLKLPDVLFNTILSMDGMTMELLYLIGNCSIVWQFQPLSFDISDRRKYIYVFFFF